MKITEYLKSFDVNIDESVYYKHLIKYKNVLFLLKKENYKCNFPCSECPVKLCYDISCLSIVKKLNRNYNMNISTQIYDRKYYKIKKGLINFLINKVKPIQEELDI